MTIFVDEKTKEICQLYSQFNGIVLERATAEKWHGCHSKNLLCYRYNLHTDRFPKKNQDMKQYLHLDGIGDLNPDDSGFPINVLFLNLLVLLERGLAHGLALLQHLE